MDITKMFFDPLFYVRVGIIIVPLIFFKWLGAITYKSVNIIVDYTLDEKSDIKNFDDIRMVMIDTLKDLIDLKIKIKALSGLYILLVVYSYFISNNALWLTLLLLLGLFIVHNSQIKLFYNRFYVSLIRSNIPLVKDETIESALRILEKTYEATHKKDEKEVDG